jgi:hypothetical protein
LPVRPTARGVDQTHQLLVQGAAQHHLDHLEGGGVGDPHPLHEARVVAEALEQTRDLLAAAVDHHHVDADPVQENDVLGEAPAQLEVLQGGAADLDDHPATAKPGNVRQCLDQGTGFVDERLHQATDTIPLHG